MMTGQKTLVSLFSETLTLSATDAGQGPAFLLLHGGAGPGSMSALADTLSTKGRVILPTHPGFNGEPRPGWFSRVDDLVLAYLALVEHLDLTKVVIVGNSFGGWLAAEMALRRSPRIAGIVLLNAVGIDPGSPDLAIVDPMAVEPARRAQLAFHNPQKFAVIPTGPQLALMAANQETLRTYACQAAFMHDPTLQSRLGGVSTPTVVAWGESDRIVPLEYGHRLAQAIPGARFERISEAGHFPQMEQVGAVAHLVETLVS